MTIKQRIMDDMKASMKSGNKDRLGTLRMLKAKIQQLEVDLRAEKGRDHELDDDESIRALSAYAKQRRDSIEGYEKAEREDLAAKERAELEIVLEYLPAQLGEDEIREIVREAVAEVGATTPREMGKVMKVVMPKLKGKADGKLVNRMVNEVLQK
jgi:uncharacterized protein YqeY